MALEKKGRENCRIVERYPRLGILACHQLPTQSETLKEPKRLQR